MKISKKNKKTRVTRAGKRKFSPNKSKASTNLWEFSKKGKYPKPRAPPEKNFSITKSKEGFLSECLKRKYRQGPLRNPHKENRSQKPRHGEFSKRKTPWEIPPCSSRCSSRCSQPQPGSELVSTYCTNACEKHRTDLIPKKHDHWGQNVMGHFAYASWDRQRFLINRQNHFTRNKKSFIQWIQIRIWENFIGKLNMCFIVKWG